jgi:hypothetical protein
LAKNTETIKNIAEIRISKKVFVSPGSNKFQLLYDRVLCATFDFAFALTFFFMEESPPFASPNPAVPEKAGFAPLFDLLANPVEELGYGGARPF